MENCTCGHPELEGEHNRYENCRPTPKKGEEYADGCTPANNIGRGHSFLPGCEKYTGGNPTKGEDVG